MKPLKIVLISAPIGAGHKKAAAALGEALEEMDSTCIVKYIDIFDFLPKKIVKTGLLLYFKSLIYLPNLYANAYRWGNHSKLAIWGRAGLSFLLSKKLKNFLAEWKPDAIVCTHASATAAVDYVLRKEKNKIYHVGVVTDFVIHRLWLSDTVSEYFIYDTTLIEENIKQFVDINKFYGYGIPIAKKFKLASIKGETGKEKTILIMGGGAGLLPMPLLLQELNKVKIPLKLIVLTGSNNCLMKTLRKMMPSIRHSIEIMGFSDQVADLMKKADLLISKPGGISVAEAIAVGLPMIIYRPLPGQEQANMRFLLKNRVAIEVQKIEEFPERIDKIFRIDNNVLSNLKKNIAEIAKPNAAEQIAKHILNKLYN